MRIGTWTGPFGIPSKQSEQRDLQALSSYAATGWQHVNSIDIGDTDAGSKFLARARALGVEFGIKPAGWLGGNWRALAALDGKAWDIYAGHEMLESHNRARRAAYAAELAAIFPQTPIRFYLDDLFLPLDHYIRAHKAGGTWADYVVADPEPNVVMSFNAGGGAVDPQNAIRKFEANAYYARIVRPGTALYCHGMARMNAIREMGDKFWSNLKTIATHLRASGCNVYLIRWAKDDGSHMNYWDVPADHIRRAVEAMRS